MALPIRKIENDTKTNRIFNEHIAKRFGQGCVLVGDDNFCLAAAFSDYQEQIRNFKVRNDDVFIVSQPKTDLFGPFWNSLLSVWRENDRPNLLLLKYADMKKDLPSEIRKVANFLEKPITEQQVETLVDHLSIDPMKKNPTIIHSVGSFVRRGEVGGYKSEMTPSQVEKFEEWKEKNLQGTNLTFE